MVPTEEQVLPWVRKRTSDELGSEQLQLKVHLVATGRICPESRLSKAPLKLSQPRS